MRRLLAALAAVAFSATAVAAVAETVAVPIDQVTRVMLRGQAADVLIGNAEIADVALIDESTVALTGKTYGSTNLIVLDRARRVIFNGEVTVSQPSNQVTVHRGVAEAKYACGARCETAVRK